MFNVGLVYLIISILKIKHLSFHPRFLRTLKLVLRFILFKLCFSREMLANNGKFVFLYALMEVTVYVTDIICITQITFEFINNILLVH